MTLEQLTAKTYKKLKIKILAAARAVSSRSR